MVKVDLSGAKMFFDAVGPDYAAAAQAHRMLFGRSGVGSEFITWLDMPKRILDTQLKAILSAAEKIKKQSKVLIVVGIGGSYPGTRAAIELLQTPSHNRISGETEVHFIGNSLSPDSINELIALIGDRDFSVNVINSPGYAIESSLGFRVAKSLLERKYGRTAARRRIFVAADIEENTSRNMSSYESYEKIPVSGDAVGAFGILSAAGLLPMAVAGIDIVAVLNTAAEEMRSLAIGSPDNPAWQYAAARQHLYSRGKNIELLAGCEPAFRCFGEWWKQLFAESEGKNSVGIFPAYVEYSSDLHTIGQYIQDGPRCLMETVVSFEHPRTEYKVPFEMGDPDGLNFIAGNSFGEIMNTAMAAVKSAHISGGVPNIAISVPCRDEAGFASLVCFFEVACGISAYMMGINPFSRPGVEEYKKQMLRILNGEN